MQSKYQIMLPLHTTLLNNEELAVTLTRLAGIWNPLLATQPLLVKLSEAAESDCAAIVLAASRKSTSDFTDPLDGDAMRDAAFTALRDFTGSWMKNPIATEEQLTAAARLQEVFDRHGNTLHRLGYTRQSGKMDALLVDLGTPASTADLLALSLTPIFERMAQAHADFEAIAADKAATESGETLPTITEHRPLLERRMNLILANLAEWLELDATPALTEAAGRMDEVIVQVMTPVLARRTKAKNTATPEVPTP